MREESKVAYWRGATARGNYKQDVPFRVAGRVSLLSHDTRVTGSGENGASGWPGENPGRGRMFGSAPEYVFPDYERLYRTLLAYCNTPKAQLRVPLRLYLRPLREGDPTLADDSHFRDLLREAKSDPLMATAQNAIGQATMRQIVRKIRRHD